LGKFSGVSTVLLILAVNSVQIAYSQSPYVLLATFEPQLQRHPGGKPKGTAAPRGRQIAMQVAFRMFVY
jgi:hypothetical protein